MITITPEELVARVAEMYRVETTPERAADYIDSNPHAGPQDFYLWLRSQGEGEPSDREGGLW